MTIANNNRLNTSEELKAETKTLEEALDTNQSTEKTVECQPVLMTAMPPATDDRSLVMKYNSDKAAWGLWNTDIKKWDRPVLQPGTQMIVCLGGNNWEWARFLVKDGSLPRESGYLSFGVVCKEGVGGECSRQVCENIRVKLIPLDKWCPVCVD